MTTSRTATPRTKSPSAMRTSLMAGLMGGVMGAVVSALVNYLIIGVPDSAATNAVYHATSGLISGFTAGFFGLLTHQRRVASASQANEGGQGLPDRRVQEAQ